jgi:hypothetical protein
VFVDEPTQAIPEASQELRLPHDSALNPDAAETPAPESSFEPTPTPQPQPVDPPITKANDATAPVSPEPMLDAPMPGDVIPDPQPVPDKTPAPTAPKPPTAPDEDLSPIVPGNVLPPAAPPAAAPASHHRDSSRAVPMRKASRLSDYLRVR